MIVASHNGRLLLGLSIPTGCSFLKQTLCIIEQLSREPAVEPEATVKRGRVNAKSHEPHDSGCAKWAIPARRCC